MTTEIYAESSSRETARVLVIGLDGATWKLLDPLLAGGRMPNLRKLMERGVYGPLETTIPAITYLGWKAYSTGKNPGKFGVFYWYKLSELKKGKMKMIDSTSYQSEEIWDWLGARGYKCGVISMPMTYPPKRVNGFMICGIPALEEMSYTYPGSLKAELEKMGHRILPEHRFRIDETMVGKKEADSLRERTIAEWEEVTEKNFLIAKKALKQGIDFLHITIQATDQMDTICGSHWLNRIKHCLRKFTISGARLMLTLVTWSLKWVIMTIHL